MYLFLLIYLYFNVAIIINFIFYSIRFPWIKEELRWFETYVSLVEPLLTKEEITNRFATCLKALNRETDEVILCCCLLHYLFDDVMFIIFVLFVDPL